MGKGKEDIERMEKETKQKTTKILEEMKIAKVIVEKQVPLDGFDLQDIPNISTQDIDLSPFDVHVIGSDGVEKSDKENGETSPPKNTGSHVAQEQGELCVPPLGNTSQDDGQNIMENIVHGGHDQKKEDNLEKVQDIVEKTSDESKRSHEIGQGSTSPSTDSFKDLLTLQMQFQHVVALQLLQIPTHAGQVGLSNMSPLYMLPLGDILYSSKREEIL